jgi:hypothetical protein
MINLIAVFVVFHIPIHAQNYELIYQIRSYGKTGNTIRNILSERCTIYIKDDKIWAKFNPKIEEVADILIDGGQNKVFYVYSNDTVFKDLYLMTPDQFPHGYYRQVGKGFVAGRECSIWEGDIDAPHLGGNAKHTLWLDPKISPSIDHEKLNRVGSPFWSPGLKGFFLKKKIAWTNIDLTITYECISVKTHQSDVLIPKISDKCGKFNPDRNVADPSLVEIVSKRKWISRIMEKTNYVRYPSLINNGLLDISILYSPINFLTNFAD